LTLFAGNLQAQNSEGKTGASLSDRSFTIGNKKITVTHQDDVISVAAGGQVPTANDNNIVVTSYSDFSGIDNRDISIWQGVRFPSVCYFPIDKHLLLRNYRNNDRMLTALDELVTNPEVIANLDTIEIIGACSPAGSDEYNIKLALSRCMTLRSYLRYKYLSLTENYPIQFNIIGVDRIGYAILKEQKANLSEKQIWDMLQYAAIRLKMKDGSYIIPGSDKQIFLTPPPEIEPANPSVNAVVEPYNTMRDTVFLKCDTIYVYATTAENTPVREREKAPVYVTLKTNLLYDALLLPNLSAEWYMGKDWSLVVEGNWSWWTFDKPIQNWWYHRIQVAGIELRKWVKSPYPLQGHAVGVYTMLGNYDVRFFTKGEYTKGSLSYQSWSAGLSYAYSFPIARRLNLEVEVAAGYVAGRYYSYDYCLEHNHWAQQAMYNRNYFGPTRIGVSLVWQLGAGNDEKSRNIYLTRKNKKFQQIYGLQK
jgi:outer membrane protein OmpA-like peptidoglycan-associated protein